MNKEYNPIPPYQVVLKCVEIVTRHLRLFFGCSVACTSNSHREDRALRFGSVSFLSDVYEITHAAIGASELVYAVGWSTQLHHVFSIAF